MCLCGSESDVLVEASSWYVLSIATRVECINSAVVSVLYSVSASRFTNISRSNKTSTDAQGCDGDIHILHYEATVC